MVSLGEAEVDMLSPAIAFLLWLSWVWLGFNEWEGEEKGRCS